MQRRVNAVTGRSEEALPSQILASPGTKKMSQRRKAQNKKMLVFIIFAFTIIIGLLVYAFTQPEPALGVRKADTRNVGKKMNPVDNKQHDSYGNSGSTTFTRRMKPVDNNLQHDSGSTITFAKPNEIYGPAGKEIMLKPAYGEHRSDKDAVFAIADGYPLNVFIQFVGSLRATGFDGDIVLGTSPMEEMEDSLQSYLTSQEGLVLYNLEKDCSKGLCKLNHLYGSTEFAVAEDIRVLRPIATSRFEAYWIWSTHYDAKSMILLLDGRDAYFQLQPFEGLERSSHSTPDGILHFFAVSQSLFELILMCS